MRLSQPTGGEVSGSVVQSFEGGNTDETHVHNKHERKWKNIFGDGSGRVEIYKGKTPDKFELAEVYTSSYNGNPSANLNTDGVTASGSAEFEEHYTFDLVTVDDREYSTETTLTTENSGGGTNIDWELWDHEERHTTTDHYEASFGADTTTGLTATDSGYTDKADSGTTCHSWNFDGIAGGPVCIVESATDHEDWPSYVDEVIAMMQEEAEAVGDADDADGEGSGAPPCATCSETDEGGADTSHENGSPTSDDPGTALSSLPWWISTLNGQIVRVTIDGITFTGENAAFDAAVHATTTGNPAAAEEIGNALRVLRVRADIAARVRAADLARLRNLRATQIRAAAGLGAEGTVSLGMVGMTIGLIGRVLDSARTIAGIGQRRQQLIDDAIVLPPVYSEDSVDPGLPVIIGK